MSNKAQVPICNSFEIAKLHLGIIITAMDIIYHFISLQVNSLLKLKIYIYISEIYSKANNMHLKNKTTVI
jgi:hypothetical protein